MIWGVRGGYVRLQDGLVMGGYVRLGPWSQPKIAPLNQTPSNKEDNNVVTSNVYCIYSSTLYCRSNENRSIGPCSTGVVLKKLS